jgi:hypothetical protein
MYVVSSAWQKTFYSEYSFYDTQSQSSQQSPEQSRTWKGKGRQLQKGKINRIFPVSKRREQMADSKRNVQWHQRYRNSALSTCRFRELQHCPLIEVCRDIIVEILGGYCMKEAEH